MIEEKIAQYNVGHMFDVLDDKIKTPGGGLIIFMGMQNHTAESVKSLQGYNVAFVEEAQSLSRKSLTILGPTIRKDGSELWFAWNPGKASDPVDQFFRGSSADRPRMACVEVNWRDNPWFPEELAQDRRDDLKFRLDEYDHIWEGGYITVSDAQIFRGKVSVEAFDTPEFARFYHGADWGFANDPSVIIRMFIQDDCLFIDDESWGYGVEIDELRALFEKVPTAATWPIHADNSRPETISFMRRQGLNVTAALKWPNSVEDGIAHLKGFKRIVIHERCPRMAEEARLYSYKTDPKTDEVLPIIVDKYNHGWDSVRYGIDSFIKARGGAGIWAKLAGD